MVIASVEPTLVRQLLISRPELHPPHHYLAPVSRRLTDCQSVENRDFAGHWAIRCASCVPDIEIHSVCEHACYTMSTKTFRVSAGLLTSRKNRPIIASLQI